MNEQTEMLAELLNDGDSKRLARVLGQWKGEIAARRLLLALLHPSCRVTLPGSLSLLGAKGISSQTSPFFAYVDQLLLAWYVFHELDNIAHPTPEDIKAIFERYLLKGQDRVLREMRESWPNDGTNDEFYAEFKEIDTQ